MDKKDYLARYFQCPLTQLPRPHFVDRLYAVISYGMVGEMKERNDWADLCFHLICLDDHLC